MDECALKLGHCTDDLEHQPAGRSAEVNVVPKTDECHSEQDCLTALLALTGTFEQLISLAIFAIWLFFALTAVALIQLRRKEPALVRPYRAWGYPWTPLIFSAAALMMTANLWVASPFRSSIGLVVILLGIPFFYYWRSRDNGALGNVVTSNAKSIDRSSRIA